MAEKKLRKDINDMVMELMEIKKELGRRFKVLNDIVKPAAIVLVALIGLKTTFKLLRMILALLWGHRLLITTITLVVFIRYSQMQSRSGSSKTC
ncbi:MAG: hypothetical protein ABSA71_18285 [Desulfomonilia bacterium]|jgi:hypothetical protein